MVVSATKGGAHEGRRRLCPDPPQQRHAGSHLPQSVPQRKQRSPTHCLCCCRMPPASPISEDTHRKKDNHAYPPSTHTHTRTQTYTFCAQQHILCLHTAISVLLSPPQRLHRTPPPSLLPRCAYISHGFHMHCTTCFIWFPAPAETTASLPPKKPPTSTAARCCVRDSPLVWVL